MQIKEPDGGQAVVYEGFNDPLEKSYSDGWWGVEMGQGTEGKKG